MSKSGKNKNNRIEITEMFMAEASNGKCFFGIIKRSHDDQGNPHVFSRITIYDGSIMACASNQRILGKMLDEICDMVLEYGIHNKSDVYIELFGEKYFYN